MCANGKNWHEHLFAENEISSRGDAYPESTFFSCGLHQPLARTRRFIYLIYHTSCHL